MLSPTQPGNPWTGLNRPGNGQPQCRSAGEPLDPRHPWSHRTPSTTAGFLLACVRPCFSLLLGDGDTVSFPEPNACVVPS